MVRKILGITAGYIAMIAIVFFSTNLLFYVLGANGSFDPGTYKVNTTWLILSMLFSLVASIVGGWVCMRIVKHQKTTMILSGIVFVLGILLSIPELTEKDSERNKLREGEVSVMESMQNAKQPRKVLLLTPLIGAIGVIAGAGIWKSSHTKHI